MSRKAFFGFGGAFGFVAILFGAFSLYCGANTGKANSIADAISNHTFSYHGAVQGGTFDADVERSVLAERVLEFDHLPQWSIRDTAKARFEEARASAEVSITAAEELVQSFEQVQREGEEAAARAWAEMRQNQQMYGSFE